MRPCSPAYRRPAVGLPHGKPQGRGHRSGYWDSTRESSRHIRCASVRAMAQHPGLRWHVGFDLTRPRIRLDPNEKIYSRARSVNEPPDPRGRLTIEPHGFWAVFTVNHRRMSCVKVSSRFSLRWWSCRWRSCQLVLRTLRTRPRRRQLKLRPLPPSHLPRSPSFPGRPSRPVRWRGGAAIGVVVGDRSVGPWGVCTGVDPGGEAIMVAPIGAVDIIGAATAVTGSITADRSKIVFRARCDAGIDATLGRVCRYAGSEQTTKWPVPVCHRRPRIAGTGRAETQRCGPWGVLAAIDSSAMSETVGLAL